MAGKRGININKQITQWSQENGGKSKGILGWTQFEGPYQPDAYLDVEQIAWKNVQVFICQCKCLDGTQVLDIAFLLNTNFPVEEKYEETLIELQRIAGSDFLINGGFTENLELWMSYFEKAEGKESEIVETHQRAGELAIRLEKIASGMRHIPQINHK